VTDWAEPRFERRDVDKSGRILRDVGTRSAEELEWAFEVMDNWRASHAFPLNTVQVGLRRRAAAVDPTAFVVQRLKRAQSILRKLERQPSMRLSQMQDLGGCRAVLRTTAGATRLHDRYIKGRTSLELAGMKDYVQEPRSSGYRSIHLVYKYRSGRIDSPAAYEGHLIEIQIRSQVHMHGVPRSRR
jgi:ppGpp synthetase/RelA/SpoT-type nucleotidyltranferase